MLLVQDSMLSGVKHVLSDLLNEYHYIQSISYALTSRSEKVKKNASGEQWSPISTLA